MGSGSGGLVALIVFISAMLSNAFLGESSEFSAMFVIGDSLVDNGNNNYLNSLAKSNYFPYGIDYPQGPSGRFNNGKTIVDFLGKPLSNSLAPVFFFFISIPAYADPLIRQKGIKRGVNFASAAGGILEESGSNLVGIIPEYIYIITLVPAMYPPSYTYDPESYADLLIHLYVGGVGPLGCIPNQLAPTLITRPGKCVMKVNDMVKSFNKRLISLVEQLNANHSNGSIFTYGNVFDAFMGIISDPAKYGFRVSNRGCCGVGKNRGLITCLPLEMPCSKRDEYVFWDAYHPTQAVNKIYAQRAFTGPTSDCYPVNVKQMAQM